MAVATKIKFRFAYGIGEAIEGDLVSYSEIVGLDEKAPDNDIRQFKDNGERYYTLVSEYTGQQRLSAGHTGCFKLWVDGHEGFPDETEAVVTSTAVVLVPEEDDMGFSEFDYDGKPKLIQKLTVTI